MKTRQGFVSNSSSASFIVALSHITPEKLQILCDWCEEHDWTVTIDEQNGVAEGYTSMDNDCIEEFLEKEGINNNPVKVSGGGW